MIVPSFVLFLFFKYYRGSKLVLELEPPKRAAPAPQHSDGIDVDPDPNRIRYQYLPVFSNLMNPDPYF